VIAENQQFKVFSGGDCGASPERRATDQVVTIDDCSKNIKGHLKTCSIAESALRLLLTRALNFGRMENMESGNGNGTGTRTSELKTVLWVSMTIVDLVRIFVLILIFLLSLLFDHGKIHLKNFLYT